MERQERLWNDRRCYGITKESMRQLKRPLVTGDAKRGLKRTREEGRVGKHWHEKKVEHKCRQEACETSGEFMR